MATWHSPERFVEPFSLGTRRCPDEYVIDPDSGCWHWQRATCSRGYGNKYDGERVRKAHRIYYEHLYGPVPAGLELDHLCRNRACVNPGHLEAVTRAVNTRRGSLTRLSAENVAVIRASTESHSALGRRFGIDPATVYAVRSGKSWVAA